MFLADDYGYLTVLSIRTERSARLFTTKSDREVVSDALDVIRPLLYLLQGQSIKREIWLRRFAYHYNFNRPTQTLDNHAPAKKALIYPYQSVYCVYIIF